MVPFVFFMVLAVEEILVILMAELGESLIEGSLVLVVLVKNQIGKIWVVRNQVLVLNH